MADKGWSRRFEDPVILPDGSKLVTLRDAGNYITKLPKAEHEAPEWQAAMEALILVATSGGPTMFARIGVMTVLIYVDADKQVGDKDHLCSRTGTLRRRGFRRMILKASHSNMRCSSEGTSLNCGQCASH
jgi:hypothetical protein